MTKHRRLVSVTYWEYSTSVTMIKVLSKRVMGKKVDPSEFIRQAVDEKIKRSSNIKTLLKGLDEEFGGKTILKGEGEVYKNIINFIKKYI